MLTGHCRDDAFLGVYLVLVYQSYCLHQVMPNILKINYLGHRLISILYHQAGILWKEGPDYLLFSKQSSTQYPLSSSRHSSNLRNGSLI
jgi:hypothetical protein